MKHIYDIIHDYCRPTAEIRHLLLAFSAMLLLFACDKDDSFTHGKAVAVAFCIGDLPIFSKATHNRGRAVSHAEDAPNEDSPWQDGDRILVHIAYDKNLTIHEDEFYTLICNGTSWTVKETGEAYFTIDCPVQKIDCYYAPDYEWAPSANGKTPVLKDGHIAGASEYLLSSYPNPDLTQQFMIDFSGAIRNYCRIRIATAPGYNIQITDLPAGIESANGESLAAPIRLIADEQGNACLYARWNEAGDITVTDEAGEKLVGITLPDYKGDNISYAMECLPGHIPTGNAGLCLLSPWFPRLFKILGLLNESNDDFKDTDARIRAIFVLQYLAYGEKDEGYKAQELIFNRLLTGCPLYIPIPERLELTHDEMAVADALLSSVIQNWNKMQNSSIQTLRQAFLLRSGQMEKQAESWTVSINSKAHDILLDSVPWSFRSIKYPWMKKELRILWNDRPEFI